MMSRVRRALDLALLCGVVLAVLAAPAEGATGDPIFHLFASFDREGEAGSPYPPPGGFEGPCGLGVDSSGDFYVSDYHRHHVDVFTPVPKYLVQLTGVDPLDGPCGLALGSAGDLFVNDFHRDVVRFTPSTFPLTPKASYGLGTVIDAAHPTGVAVDPASGDVYVDDRTYIAVYEPSGAPVEVGGEPLRIGQGSLADGYGVAVSAFPATAGHVYVPDAGDETVKVYDPALDADNPVATIDGGETPKEGFVSLRDSAIAIDQGSGRVYVADDLLPEFFEAPEAAIYAFEASGSYAGRLKLNVIDALPPGLAVDNSGTVTQGRVYVSSGNSEGASVYAYGPEAATKSPGQCAEGGPCPLQGTGGGAVPTLSAAPPPGPLARPSRAPGKGAGGAAIAQRGNLRVSVNGSISPHALPRRGTAPVGFSVIGRISTTDGSPPPRLRRLRIEINRHGRLDPAGLPLCPYERIQPASSSRALAACRPALVGQGRFQAEVSLAGQQRYPASGRLLVFNGRLHGRAALLGQIYAPRPFANSFVVPFTVSRQARGTFGTVLDARLPRSLGSWGRVTGIEMRLRRSFFFHGARRSYLSAGCPAPSGFPGATFPLVRTSFSFAGDVALTSTLDKSCTVR
jgi:DNA-binding beta-propeller fold protein YncE